MKKTRSSSRKLKDKAKTLGSESSALHEADEVALAEARPDARPPRTKQTRVREPERDARAAQDESYDPLDEFFVSDRERELALGFTGESITPRRSRDMLELLAFWVADEEYAIPIVEIQEIIKIPTITEVPRAHVAVMGITSLRGTIVPVLDLRMVLGLERQPITRQSRILVLQAGGDPVGLLVDRVTSVVRLENDAIEPTPRAMQRYASELLRGVGRVGNRLIIVLEVEAVLSVMENAA